MDFQPSSDKGRGSSVQWPALTLDGAIHGANSLVAHARATNPAVAQLALGVERWHRDFRSEAQQRLQGGLVTVQPPLRLTNGILGADDWDLLKRVGGGGVALSGSNNNSTNNNFSMLSLIPNNSGLMKRSASENTLNNWGSSARPARPWVWDEWNADTGGASSAAGAGHSSPSPLLPQQRHGHPPYTFQGEASVISTTRRGSLGSHGHSLSTGGLLTNTNTDQSTSEGASQSRNLPSQSEPWAHHSTQPWQGTELVPVPEQGSTHSGMPFLPPRYSSRHQGQHSQSFSGWGGDTHQLSLLQSSTSPNGLHQHQSSGLQEGGSLLLPRVATAPLLQELGDSLNLNAQRNFEAMRLAIQNAQLSIKETASNCQQNLQTLSTMLQQNLNSGGSPLQTALSSSHAMVTWSIANGNDPVGGALVPWQVFPRYLRAREYEASQQAQQGSSFGGGAGGASSHALSLGPHSHPTDSEEGGSGPNSGGKGGGGAGGGSAIADWVTPLEQYMSQLDSKWQLRKRKPGSIRDPGRQVAIVTTAALPWLTGTSVNPLLRAAYLASDGQRQVTLVIPWLSQADQQRVFPANVHFDAPEDQEAYVKDWARKRTGLECNFKVTFYPSRYAAEKGSILPVGDITSVIPDNEADVAVLEEPEHLNWYHHGMRWTDKFNHVVGVMHTNYLDYARREENGGMKEAILKHINAWVCRIHCHKVIKLSDAVQPLPRESTMFVHGVSPAFLRVGQAKAEAAQEGKKAFERGAYFLGKVLWAKGYTELLDRLNEHASRTGAQVAVDVYGSGPDLKAVEDEAERRRLGIKFNGARDHADADLQEYKVFINPSLSDVVATTTAEALAMGKWVVCADHPSNAFFQRFPNCLIYKDSQGFSQCLSQALSRDPTPLSPSQLHALTWEAATERFLDVAEPAGGKGVHPGKALEAGLDTLLHAAHNTMTGFEFVRVAMGAGAHTRDAPAKLTDYVPCEMDVGGFFDDSSRVKRSWIGKRLGKTRKGEAAAAAAAAAEVVAEGKGERGEGAGGEGLKQQGEGLAGRGSTGVVSHAVQGEEAVTTVGVAVQRGQAGGIQEELKVMEAETSEGGSGEGAGGGGGRGKGPFLFERVRRGMRRGPVMAATRAQPVAAVGAVLGGQA